MFRYNFFGRILVTLLVIALLIGGTYAIYRTGWTQGYQTGAVVSSGTTQGQGNNVLPVFPYYPRFYYGPFPFFNPFGFFFGIGIFFLIIFFFRLLFWRSWGPWRYGPRHWGYGYPPDPNDPSWREYQEWKERQAQPGNEPPGDRARD